MAIEYPLFARWYSNMVPASDITSVNYVVEEYNPATDVFDSLSSGTIGSADAGGRWIVPFSVPDVAGFKVYVATYTPVGGSHSVLSEQVEVIDGVLAGGSSGSGTETHSGTVCDSDGNPLEGVAVKAVPCGAIATFASDTTDSNGDYSLEGLHSGHAYEILFNKNGYWAKQSNVVIA